MDDRIEDILITLGRQYYLIRPLASTRGSLFLYLAPARHNLKRLEAGLEV